MQKRWTHAIFRLELVIAHWTTHKKYARQEFHEDPVRPSRHWSIGGVVVDVEDLKSIFSSVDVDRSAHLPPQCNRMT